MRNQKKIFATITDIQRFSLHDGPGIRTVVFFKGCPLQCQWCQNPETQEHKPQIMFFANACIGCGACVAACPRNGIQFDERLPLTNAELCTNCGNCANACMSNARKMCGERYDIDRVLDVVMRDATFYRNSGGGVTLSGGEVTQSAAFAAELLRQLKERNIHTAIETCGFCTWEIMESIARWTDLVLYDIKHIDDNMHRIYTGQGVDVIHRNLVNLRALQKDVIIRVPLIPGVNDSDETIRGIGELAKTTSITKVHILPFHQAGENKWKAVGKEYHFAQYPPLEESSALRAAQLLCEMGISASVGGGE